MEVLVETRLSNWSEKVQVRRRKRTNEITTCGVEGKIVSVWFYCRKDVIESRGLKEIKDLFLFYETWKIRRMNFGWIYIIQNEYRMIGHFKSSFTFMIVRILDVRNRMKGPRIYVRSHVCLFYQLRLICLSIHYIGPLKHVY